MSTKEQKKSYVKKAKKKSQADRRKPEPAKKEGKKKNGRGGKAFGTVILLFLVLYAGLSVYFHTHFFIGTTINGFECQFMTVEEAKKQMEQYTKEYELVLEERLDREEKITADQIDFHYVDNGKLEEWKEDQKGYLWIQGLLKGHDYEDRESFIYNEDKLTDAIAELTCFDSENITKPHRAYPAYNEGTKKYEIIPEVEGNQVVKKTLTKSIQDSIENGKEVLNLDKAECYKKPLWYKEDKEVLEARDTMNQYISSKITYDMGYTKEEVDVELIHEWIKVDKNCKVSIDKEKVAEYVLSLAYKYNTVGKSRYFETPSGKGITVSGGTYGWRINQDETVTDLCKLIKKGKAKETKPSYTQTGLNRDSSGDDLHDTYIAISISQQTMWFYKNGKCLISTPVVTGDKAEGMDTPKGVYSIAWKQRDKVLRGEDYETPVSYWLPFITYRGIGIHDADWRAEFGKDIYKTNGSHGCVNTPRNAVSYIYENVSAGTPVVVY